MRKLTVLAERAVAETKALQVQTAIDFDQKVRDQIGHVSCNKGCSWCCHHPFLISLAEGFLLERHLKRQGLWTSTLKKRLEETRDKTIGLATDIWLLSNIPCPLLEDRKCTAYEARPLHCRATYSSGDPENCHPHELGPETGILEASTAVILDYFNRLDHMFKKAEMPSFLMPLSEAVLLAHQIDSGALKLSEAANQYVKDLVNE